MRPTYYLIILRVNMNQIRAAVAVKVAGAPQLIGRKIGKVVMV